MSFSIGLSGLNAAVARLDKAASSVARASIPPPPEAAEQAAPTAAGAESIAPSGAPSVDLVNAVVEQISASSAFMANVKTIEVTDRNLEALLKLR